VRARRIALVGAPGGRDLIAPTLRRRGANVETIHVYRRVPPRLTRRHFDALAAARDPLITLVSSGEALTHLVTLLPPPALARLRTQILVVSSARLAASAANPTWRKRSCVRSEWRDTSTMPVATPSHGSAAGACPPSWRASAPSS
jgi:uroporphyrinogen-III synthase